ncbi:hypothetical protein [Streptomyces sp. NBC_01481]|nr:hypothetical protein [Streptomyces sp. NBC_01481]MCX4588124.1 hypothetical protein [Streptomyces sp. NBC_01481]
MGRLLGLRSRPWATVSVDLRPGAQAQARFERELPSVVSSSLAQYEWSD